jgi:hypothetical protein
LLLVRVIVQRYRPYRGCILIRHDNSIKTGRWFMSPSTILVSDQSPIAKQLSACVELLEKMSGPAQVFKALTQADLGQPERSREDLPSWTVLVLFGLSPPKRRAL